MVKNREEKKPSKTRKESRKIEEKNGKNRRIKQPKNRAKIAKIKEKRGKNCRKI